MISLFTTLYALMGLGQYGLNLVLLLRFKKRSRELDQRLRALPSQEKSGPLPGISLLMPVKGIIPSFERNFKSLLGQKYAGPLELIVAVRDTDDPVIMAAKRLVRDHPSSHTVKFAIGEVDLGLNPKNSNLARGFREATQEWIYCADSDLGMDDLHLHRCIDSVRQNPEFFATTMTVNEGARSLGAKLEATGSNLEIAAFFLFSSINSHKMNVLNGGSMLFHKKLLARVGGFEASLNTLTDDLFLGKLFHQAGAKGVLVAGLVRENLIRQSFKAYHARIVRWILIGRCFRPELYWIAPTCWHWQWLLLLGLLLRNEYVLCASLVVLVARLLTGLATQMTLGTPRRDWLNLWVLVIYDWMALLAWVQGAFETQVIWNGTRLNVLRNGGLVRSSE